MPFMGSLDTLREEQGGILNIVLACPSSVDTEFHRRLILEDGSVGEHKRISSYYQQKKWQIESFKELVMAVKEINIGNGLSSVWCFTMFTLGEIRLF